MRGEKEYRHYCEFCHLFIALAEPKTLFVRFGKEYWFHGGDHPDCYDKWILKNFHDASDKTQ